jgi:hypothetical protein
VELKVLAPQVFLVLTVVILFSVLLLELAVAVAQVKQ